MLNKIDFEALPDGEIDDTNKAELKKLARSLGLEFKEHGRIAPSIILRSELQLFGCAAPRFAYRLYFKNAEGFVNVRRLPRFGKSITLYQVPSTEVVKILQEDTQSCIADCLLPRPKYLPSDRFHLIETSLSKAYGETAVGYGINDYAGTPYVKSISLGGGLCGQACAFMVAAILHEHCSGVHGLAEITALAHPRRRKRLSISGINRQLMQRYFSSIGLTMSVQSAKVEIQKDMSVEQARTLEYENALKAYCLSNIPVIVPMDMGRMLGYPSLRKEDERKEDQDIYKKNGFLPDYQGIDRTKNRQHCVVIVGCKKLAEPGKEEVFVFNDPSGHPFMFAPTRLILNSGPYAGPLLDTTVRFQFWPITPAAVKMPLLAFEPAGAFEHQRGLKWLSYWYRNSDGSRPLTSKGPSKHFRLMQLGNISKAGYIEPLPHPLWNNFRGHLKAISERLRDSHFLDLDHWVWLEIMESGIWIWDAQIEPNYSDAAECLLAELNLYGDTEIRVQFPEGYEID